MYTLASINQRPPALPHRGYNWSLFCLCVSFLSPVTVTQVLCFLSLIYVFMFIVCVCRYVYTCHCACVWVRGQLMRVGFLLLILRFQALSQVVRYQVSLPLSLLSRPPLSLCCWWTA